MQHEIGVNKNVNYIEPKIIEKEKEVVKQKFFPQLITKEICICWEVL